jgi:amidase
MSLVSCCNVPSLRVQFDTILPFFSIGGLTYNTAPFNGTGHPALSIPIGWARPAGEDILSSSDEAIQLPVGMQIVGKMWDEAMILRVADAWEQAFDWKTGKSKAV